MTTLESPRLVLRPWRDDDLAPFAALNADPEVMRYFPSTLSVTESDQLARRARDHIIEQGWGLWAVEVRGGDSFIGFVGLARPRFDAPFTPAIEIGWRLARSAWGYGYAPEAARAAIDFAFRELALAEIVSFTTVSNLPSRRVMAKLGMSHDPADDFEHPSLAEDHPLRRHVLYRLVNPSRLAPNRAAPAPAVEPSGSRP